MRNEILKDFLSVRSFITLGAFFCIYGLVIFGKPVPDIIVRIVDLLLGFWFGQKATQIANGKKEEGK